jgi:ATP-binding cassette subfamily B protein
VLFLAAINIGFSLIDPWIFGKLINLASYHQQKQHFNWHDFLFAKTPILNFKGETQILYGVVYLLLGSITVAMVSGLQKTSRIIFKCSSAEVWCKSFY